MINMQNLGPIWTIKYSQRPFKKIRKIVSVHTLRRLINASDDVSTPRDPTKSPTWPSSEAHTCLSQSPTTEHGERS